MNSKRRILGRSRMKKAKVDAGEGGGEGGKKMEEEEDGGGGGGGEPKA